jgi:hypothetical protein
MGFQKYLSNDNGHLLILSVFALVGKENPILVLYKVMYAASTSITH